MNKPNTSENGRQEFLFHSPLLHSSQFCARMIVVYFGFTAGCIFLWALSSSLPFLRSIAILLNVLVLLSLASVAWSGFLVLKAFLFDCPCGRRLERLSGSRRSRLRDLILRIECVSMTCFGLIFVLGKLTHELYLSGAVSYLLGGTFFFILLTSGLAESFETRMRLVTDPQLSQEQLAGMTIHELTDLMSLADAAGENENAALISKQISSLSVPQG